MSNQLPVITIQCDWNDVIRYDMMCYFSLENLHNFRVFHVTCCVYSLPNADAWISSKKLNENSVHDKFKTSVNITDNKIKITFTNNYQYISHGNLNLVVKHNSSGLKVAFVAPTKPHKVHSKAVLSVDTAENALAVSSCEGDRLLVWDSRTSK